MQLMQYITSTTLALFYFVSQPYYALSDAWLFAFDLILMNEARRAAVSIFIQHAQHA